MSLLIVEVANVKVDKICSGLVLKSRNIETTSVLSDNEEI